MMSPAAKDGGGATVEALDHVNIRTPDVEGLCRFFGDMLGMDVRPVPGQEDIANGAWICDGQGRACLHIGRADMIYPTDDAGNHVASTTAGSGLVHHVAFRCTGFDAMARRLNEREHPFQTNHFPPMNLRQIFVEDPNGIMFELNFFGD